MKKSVIFIFSLAILFSCKTERKEIAQESKKELTILEKVANAHGYQQWKNVNEIQFTFNVDRDSSHYDRNWTWNTRTHNVTLKTNTAANSGFINDKYWLLAPFNLVWDKNITHEHIEKSEAPVSKQEMQKLTIVYSNEGGYTPGDAYDFYFGDDYVVKEWVFRKGNAEAPSLITTWEDYETINGLKIAKVHKRDSGNWKLFFTDIAVK